MLSTHIWPSLGPQIVPPKGQFISVSAGMVSGVHGLPSSNDAHDAKVSVKIVIIKVKINLYLRMISLH